MYSLARFISFVIEVYAFIIMIRAIISWVNPDPYNPIVQILFRLTEPLLSPIRRALFRSTGNMRIDFSPFIAIMLLYIIKRILLRLLMF
jgi:YggT family protein